MSFKGLQERFLLIKRTQLGKQMNQTCAHKTQCKMLNEVVTKAQSALLVWTLCLLVGVH